MPVSLHRSECEQLYATVVVLHVALLPVCLHCTEQLYATVTLFGCWMLHYACMFGSMAMNSCMQLLRRWMFHYACMFAL